MGVVACFMRRSRAEEKKMPYAKPPVLGLVFPESGWWTRRSSGAGGRRRLSERGFGSRQFIQSAALASARITGMRL